MAATALQGRHVQITVNEPWERAEAGPDNYDAKIDAVKSTGDDGRLTSCLLAVESGIRGVHHSDFLVASLRYADSSLEDLLVGSAVEVNCAPVPEAVRGMPEALEPDRWWRGGEMLICSMRLEPK